MAFFDTTSWPPPSHRPDASQVDMFYMWKLLKSVTSTPPRIEVALSNLIRHYRESTNVAFVEHFLSLGVPISPANIDFMRRTRLHGRLCFVR
jgi:hypothetical protein